MADVEERTVDVDGVRIFYREVAAKGPTTVFVHGNPTHSALWLPFLRRIGAAAIAPDLPGWGRSERPRGFDYSMHGLAAFVERFLERTRIRDYRLVVQDWGGLALIAAQRHPDRVDRLVVVNCVPLLPGYRWHWIARFVWRVPVVGELLNLAWTRSGIARGLRGAGGDRQRIPDDFVDMIWSAYERGVNRPILELYRSADPDRLAEAGARLDSLSCPALVVWGERDPYLGPEFGRLYSQRLPNAELVLLPDAGHWPWLDRPDVIDRVLDFLRAGG